MRTSTVLVVLSLLLIVAAAVHADPPTIAKPGDGETVGPSVTVSGTAPGAASVNVWTECHDAADGRLLKNVPGLKHAVNADGGYEVRIATPRIYFGEGVKLRYEVHVKSLNGADAVGEASVTVHPQAQAENLETAPGEGEAPVVIKPREGQTVGPNVDIEGRAQPGALVVIRTEVYNNQTNEMLRDVPGIRHLSGEGGKFSFRIATPRVFIGEDVPLRYEIHVKAAVDKRYTAETIIVVNPQ
jgi:hypothetical protein